MCGICGIINFDGQRVESNRIKTMMERMKHRGPDDDGTFFRKNIGLGFVRLSILDLTKSGHQPMYSHNGRYVIVFNGEVYNYLELRTELQDRYLFKTGTDTEVVLAAYQEWGEKCLDRFNGMFAFVIYDLKSGSIFGARDRFGIKPFYYYRDNNIFIFASEIPSILSVMKKKTGANNQAIFDYLAFNRTDQTENTFFEGIKKIQHGCFFKIQNSKFKIQKWYDLKDNSTDPFNDPEQFRELFSDSLKLRLRSDVPVGVCLSGGLDSSSIVSTLIADFNKKDLNTFSAVYGKGETGDESVFISEYSNELKNMFFTTPTAASLFDDKEVFIKAHSEPIPSTSPYAQFKVMELAKKNVVVTLDGQGADEQLAGYHYFFGFYFKDLLKRVKIIKLFSESFHYLKNHHSLYGLKTMIYFLIPEIFKSGIRTSEHNYINKYFLSRYSSSNTITKDLYGSKSLNDSLFAHFEFKLEHLLKWEDRNSMHFSLESRVPFLDHRFVEKTLSLPSNIIIRKGMTKHILREAMQGVLPESIRLRKDKVGFDTPQDKWFRTDKFKNYIVELLNSESFKNRGIIDKFKAEKMFSDHLGKKMNISKEIWKWINLELWFREFID